MGAIHLRLARANGRGSAGKCPTWELAKTPAVRESVRRVAAERDQADGTAQSLRIRCDIMSARAANWAMLHLREWPSAVAEARALRDSAMQSARAYRSATDQEFAP